MPPHHPSGRLYADAWGTPDRDPTRLPVYAMLVAWVSGTDALLGERYGAMRAALGLRRDYEFHARRLTKGERASGLPLRFFEQLLASDVEFEAWCAVMEKRRSRLPPEVTGKALVHELVAQAALRMPSEKIDGYTLTFDDQRSGKKVSTAARELRARVNAALAAAGRTDKLSRVVERPAHQSAGIQLADFLAAAVVTPWPECLAVLPAGRLHVWET